MKTRTKERSAACVGHGGSASLGSRGLSIAQVVGGSASLGSRGLSVAQASGAQHRPGRGGPASPGPRGPSVAPAAGAQRRPGRGSVRLALSAHLLPPPISPETHTLSPCGCQVNVQGTSPVLRVSRPHEGKPPPTDTFSMTGLTGWHTRVILWHTKHI